MLSRSGLSTDPRITPSIPECFTVVFVVVVLLLLKVETENKDVCCQLKMTFLGCHIAVGSRSSGPPAELIITVVDTKAQSTSNVSRLLMDKCITEIICQNLVIINVCGLKRTDCSVIVTIPLQKCPMEKS